MLSQLLLSKRLFHEGTAFAQRTDAVSCGLAISLFQDAVEMCIWALVKDRSIPVKDTSSFTANLDAIEKVGIALADRAKILELNKARVGFKHYGNLPAPDEARKFQIYAEDFLRVATSAHFGQDFDDLSLVDLVSFPEVRERLKSAEASISNSDLKHAIREIAIAKVLLFSHLERHIPDVDHNLQAMDGVLERASDTRGIGGFKYIAGYLDLLREISLATLLRVPLTDYTYLRTTLPTATRYGDGNWRTVDTRLAPDEPQCRRAIAILVELSIRLEGAV